MFATFLTRQLIFDGVMSGLVYGLLALGIVLVYRATRVINFAVGNLGMVGTGLFVLVAVQYEAPYWIALAIGLLVGTLWGAFVELAVIRRLFDAPRVIVLVATIGIAQLSLAVLAAYPDVDVRGARFPVAIGGDRRLLDVRVTGAQLMTILVVPALTLGLGWFLTRTTLGRTVKASASNRDLARLSGINPKVVSTLVWAAAGFLSTVSLTLIAGQAGSATELDTLGPSTLVRALAAAVLAGMTSFSRAVVAGVAIGVVQALIQFNWLDQPGLTDFVLLVVVLVAIYLQTRSGSTAEEASFAFAPKVHPVPDHLRDRWWVRHIDRLGLVVLGVVGALTPLLVEQASRQLLYTVILGFALCGLSVTLLTGWAGQLSLGQMAFAGLGALLTAGFQRGLSMNVGWQDVRIINARLDPLSFGPSLVLGALVTALVAALVGAGALRVRGLLLAVSTFSFAIACSQYLFRRPFLTGGAHGSVRTPRSDFFGIDLTSQRAFYYFALAALVVGCATVGRLRRTGVGRTTVAVRDNPDTASAYTVDPARVKLRAFALSGALAAVGGVVLSGAVQSVPNDRFFTVGDSLLLVAMVVIGGLGSTTGPIIGALWVVGLAAFFPDNDLVPLLTSSVGLLILLLYFPGGLVQIAYAARTALLGRLQARQDPTPSANRGTLPVQRRAVPAVEQSGAPLDADSVEVRFGGVAAVDGVSLTVGDGEIVGLIGTNGAGKSTLMNAIGGFVPSRGTVLLEGHDVSRARPSTRARHGLGRTFQAATLFPELTVRETVAVALEARGRTGLLSAALVLPRSVRAERRKRAEADEIIDFIGLGRYADSFVSELSTGTRRIVELAGLLALDARVLCLDEPTAGVAQRETEAFGPLLLEIRRELGACMLVIEHDMPLIMSISDRVLCLERGRVIASGAPQEVRRDPAVIASYLGTDERAIARSGAATE